MLRQLNSVQRRQISIGGQYETCFMAPYWPLDYGNDILRTALHKGKLRIMNPVECCFFLLIQSLTEVIFST